jgi:hypothetical protein
MCLELKGNLFTQKNKSYMGDRTKAEVNMKLVKCKPSKSQTQKWQVLLRISSSSGSEQEMIAHLSDGNEEAECSYCCSLFSGDPEGEEWVCCTVCLKLAHTL